MYTAIDVVARAEDAAEERVFLDRKRYEKFMAAAEHFAAEHGLIVGGETATRLLIGDASGPAPVRLDSFHLEFYSQRAVPHARALGDALYAVDPDGLGHYTSVQTKVADYLMAVQVDGRELATVTNLPRHRGVSTAAVVIPTPRPSQFARDAAKKPLTLKCMGPEIQLIEVYAKLCDPALAADWGKNAAAEASLRGIFCSEVAKKIEGVTTGGDAPKSMPQLRRRLLEDFCRGLGRVLVGAEALALTAGGPPGRLQVVSAEPLEREAAAAAAIAARLGYETAWRIDDPQLPTEPRLRRMTLHVVLDRNRREAVLDVYNAAAFELIPYRMVNGLRVGTVFVLMRFRLIDMWTLLLLIQMRAIDLGFGKQLLRGHLDGYRRLVKDYEATLRLEASEAVAQLMPAAAYSGRFEDPEIAIKRAASSGTRYYPYYPAAKTARKDAAASEEALAANDKVLAANDKAPAANDKVLAAPEPRDKALVEDTREDARNTREDTHNGALNARNVREDARNVREDARNVREDARTSRESINIMDDIVVGSAPQYSSARGGEKKAAKKWAVVDGICPAPNSKEVEEIANHVYGVLTKGRRPMAKGTTPHAVVTIGAPGVGKSTVARHFVELTSEYAFETYVEVDFDKTLDYLRVGEVIRDLPAADGSPTGVGDAYGWTKCIDQYWEVPVRVLHRLLEDNFNIILQSHMMMWIVDFQTVGYHCSLLYVVASPATAKRRAAARALAEGRFLIPATEQNSWGWAGFVDRSIANYRKSAPWYALWASNFYIIVNEADRAKFSAADFVRVDLQKAAPLRAAQEAVARAHFEAENAASRK
jgi:hypothetical protein